jgi:hypothetical protein
MNYMDKYSTDDLFDMFANQADFRALLSQQSDITEQQLLEMAPDMEDVRDVAASIKRAAGELARRELNRG